MIKEIQQASHQSLLFAECPFNQTPHFHYRPHLDAIIYSRFKASPESYLKQRPKSNQHDMELLRVPCSATNDGYVPHETTGEEWAVLSKQDMQYQCWRAAFILALGGKFPYYNPTILSHYPPNPNPNPNIMSILHITG